MKRLLALGALTAAAVALTASPAVADAPPGQGLETFRVDCAEGTITVVGSPGDSASRWIDGQHMVLLSITFSDGVTIVAKNFGKKTGLAERGQLHGDGPVRHAPRWYGCPCRRRDSNSHPGRHAPSFRSSGWTDCVLFWSSGWTTRFVPVAITPLFWRCPNA